MKGNHFKKFRGFTLIELLIVIGIIAILASIIYVAVDPARRLAEAKNAERWSSSNAVLNAVLKYSVDNSGNLPGTIDDSPSTVQIIGENGGAITCVAAQCGSLSLPGTNCFVADLDNDLVDEYLVAMPVDPDDNTFSNNHTGYYINKSTNGRITVGACSPERNVAISVSR